MDYRKYSYLDAKAMAVIVEIYSSGGEIVGFRSLSQKLQISYHSLKEILMHLEYNGIIRRDSGPNNIMIIRLTDKGKDLARLILQLIDVLDK